MTIPFISRLDDASQDRVFRALSQLPLHTLIFLERTQAEFCMQGSHSDCDVALIGEHRGSMVLFSKICPLLVLRPHDDEVEVYKLVAKLAAYAAGDHLQRWFEDYASPGSRLVQSFQDALTDLKEGTTEYNMVLSEFQFLVVLSNDIKEISKTFATQPSFAERKLFQLVGALQDVQLGHSVAQKLLDSPENEGKIDLGISYLLAHYVNKHLSYLRAEDLRPFLTDIVGKITSLRHLHKGDDARKYFKDFLLAIDDFNFPNQYSLKLSQLLPKGWTVENGIKGEENLIQVSPQDGNRLSEKQASAVFPGNSIDNPFGGGRRRGLSA